MLSAALAPRLEERGFSILTEPELGSNMTYVEVVQCDANSLDGWLRLKRTDDLNRIGYIAIIDKPDLEMYRRAYNLEAAVILDDTSPEVAADIIAARSVGEIRVPAGLLRALLGADRRRLSERELIVFREIVAGRTLAQVAASTHYSERHIRRILNTVLAKAGTSSRGEAADFFSDDLVGEVVSSIDDLDEGHTTA